MQNWPRAWSRKELPKLFPPACVLFDFKKKRNKQITLDSTDHLRKSGVLWRKAISLRFSRMATLQIKHIIKYLSDSLTPL